MYQKVIIIGYVGKDPEMRYTPQGKAVTNFSVATSEKWDDKERTTWWRVTTWNKQAEVCNMYVKKRMLVMIEGKVNSDENGNPKTFKKQDGSAGANFEITAQNVKFLSRVEAEAMAGSQGENDGSGLDEGEDSFPF